MSSQSQNAKTGPQADPSRPVRAARTDEAVAVGGVLTAALLSAGLGIWLGRRRRERTRGRADPTAGPQAGQALPFGARVHASAGRRRQAAPVRLDRFLQGIAPLLTLAAAWRDGAEQARVRNAARAAVTPPLSNIKVDLEPAPSEYLGPAADVQMIHGGSRFQQAWQMSRAAVNAWLDDFAPSMGAAIAYYTIFSIAPMLVIAIAVAGMIFGHEAAQGEIVGQIRDIVGTEGAFAIQGLLVSVSRPREGLIAAAISALTLAVGATAVFSELQSALDRIWRIPALKRKAGAWQLLRTRLLSFGLILGLGFLLIISLVVSAALAALGRWWGGWFEGWQLVLQLLNFLFSLVVFSTLFSMIYKFMPRVTLSWRDVWIGAVVTTILFIIGKSLIGFYLGRTGMTSGFGAAGSFALLLVWIYYSAQIFLLGAEFTWIYANNFGSRASRQKRVTALETQEAVVEPDARPIKAIRSPE